MAKVYSPYQASKLISKELGKEIRPQQVYGYIRKNEKLIRKNELGHLIVDDKFIADYVAGRKAAAEKKAAETAETKTEVAA